MTSLISMATCKVVRSSSQVTSWVSLSKHRPSMSLSKDSSLTVAITRKKPRMPPCSSIRALKSAEKAKWPGSRLPSKKWLTRQSLTWRRPSNSSSQASAPSTWKPCANENWSCRRWQGWRPVTKNKKAWAVLGRRVRMSRSTTWSPSTSYLAKRAIQSSNSSASWVKSTKVL